MHQIILRGIVFIILTVPTINLTKSGSPVINCPNIAFLDDSARITCSTSVNFTNTIYSCPCGFEHHCLQSGCPPLSGYNASIVNRTQTELTILSAQPQHAGKWSCTDGEGEGQSFCNLVLTRIPSVTITSDVDADSVNLGDRISLTVDIGGYYCSGPYLLTLLVGSVNYTPGSGGNNTNRNLTKTISFNVTQTHLGDVELVFVCDNNQWNITPEGVYELQSNISKTPTCNITSEKNTETLTLHEEVSLNVDVTLYCDIRGSLSSKASKFTLQTGEVSHFLNVGDQGLQPVTFKVTEAHLGNVRVSFNSKDKHWNLSCDGVTQLCSKKKPSDDVATASAPIIIAGVTVSLVLMVVIVVAIIIVFLVKQKLFESTVRLPYNGTVQQAVDIPTVDTQLSAVSGSDILHPEAGGYYMALDRNIVQPSNIYEHLTTYEQI